MSDIGKGISAQHYDNHPNPTHKGAFAPPSDNGERQPSVQGQPAYAEEGLLINHDIPQADTVPQGPDLAWSRIRRRCREPFAEFFGMFIFILFGDGAIAQVVLSNGRNGDWQSIAWGWG